MAIRPEHVIVEQADGEGLPGVVTALTYLGSRTACLVTLADGTLLKAERDDLPPVAVGTQVRCRLPPPALVPLGD